MILLLRGNKIRTWSMYGEQNLILDSKLSPDPQHPRWSALPIRGVCYLKSECSNSYPGRFLPQAKHRWLKLGLFSSSGYMRGRRGGAAREPPSQQLKPEVFQGQEPRSQTPGDKVKSVRTPRRKDVCLTGHRLIQPSINLHWVPDMCQAYPHWG